MLSVGSNIFFETSANWDGLQDSLTGNTIDFGLGLEYTLTDNILVSAGFLATMNGAEDAYQSDMSYSLPSNSVALGGKYKILDNLDVNLGFVYTIYGEGEKPHMHNVGGLGLIKDANYTFAKSTYLFAIGFDWQVFGK